MAVWVSNWRLRRAKGADGSLRESMENSPLPGEAELFLFRPSPDEIRSTCIMEDNLLT